MKHVLVCYLILTGVVYGQDRILVNPNNEIIYLSPKRYAISLIKENMINPRQLTSCENAPFIFGYHPNSYPSVSDFGGYHKDVFGMWFIAPANGTIDTFYWKSASVGSLDSTVSIRIFKSNVHPGSGPGYSPYPPPCLNWGYYINSNDSDQHITPFRDERTDTNWVSTEPNGLPTFDPLGEELTKRIYKIKVEPYSVNALPLKSLGDTITLNEGDAFFVTMRVNSLNQHYPFDTNRVGCAAWDPGVPVGKSSQDWPSRLWKFYEHDSGPSNCAGYPQSSLKKGWIARGPFTDDSLSTSAYNWWYSMTINTFIPSMPQNILKSGEVEGEPLRFQFIKLCSLSDSDRVGTYWLQYQFNNNPWDSVKATVTADSMLEVVLPPQLSGTIVTFRYFHITTDGLRGYSATSQFRVIGLIQNGYKLDTASTYQWSDVDSSYTLLNNFFLRPGADTLLNPFEDGTAGPVDLGFPFNFFGETVQYAWIGINGGIALSSSAIDTIHVNCNSYYCLWDIPGSQTQSYGVPKNFIAPYWYDFNIMSWMGDPPPPPSGEIHCKSEPTKFTVDWKFLNGIGQLIASFRLQLSKTDSSISFIYHFLDSSVSNNLNALIGLEADTLRWFHLFRSGRPLIFKPTTPKVFKFTPLFVTGVKERELPRGFKLEQNYPNPFNPITIIRYQLPMNCNVKIKIYNLLGQKIATLVDDYQSAGYKSVLWNGTNYPSGVYFYEMNAGHFQEQRKLILIK